MKKILLVLLTFFNLISFGQNISLTYKVTKEYEQDEKYKDISVGKENSKSIPENTKKIEQYKLFKEGYLIKINEDANKKIIYNFINEQITTIDNKTYDIVPLYHIINYRVMEFQNRRMITGALEAGGLDNAFGGMFNLESLFGFEGDPNNFKEQIRIKKSQKIIEYIYKKETVVSIELSDTKITDKDIYEKFLIYNTSIHPVIIKLIIQNDLYPKIIEYKYSNVATLCNVKYEMTDIFEEKQSFKNISSLNELTVYKPEDDKIKSFINEVYAQKLNNKTELLKKEECLLKSEKYINEEKYFDALLTLFEYLLQSGIQPTEGFRNVLKYVDKDENMKIAVASLNSGTSKEALNGAINNLEQINQEKYDIGYILNVFLANKYTGINSSKDFEYFYKALRVNPNITGVYKDLGQSYAMKYDFEYAWKCYDIGLLINAENPMFKSIIDYKTMFKNDFPMYFKQ